MQLKNLLERPSPKVTRGLLIAAIVLLVIVYPIMGYYFQASGDDLSLILQSQLSFDGAYLTAQYTALTDLAAYRAAQAWDYGFMVAYGLLTFTLALILARKTDPESFFAHSGPYVAVAGIAAAGCDAVENAFIHATIDEFEATSVVSTASAVAHSSFALVKWILLVGAVAWAIWTGITLLAHRKKRA